MTGYMSPGPDGKVERNAGVFHARTVLKQTIAEIAEREGVSGARIRAIIKAWRKRLARTGEAGNG